jgi:spore germination protein YaaH
MNCVIMPPFYVTQLAITLPNVYLCHHACNGDISLITAQNGRLLVWYIFFILWHAFSPVGSWQILYSVTQRVGVAYPWT